MEKIEKIECMCIRKSKGPNIRAKNCNCTVIMKYGSISFALEELNVHFLVDQTVLEDALKNKKLIETECVWMKNNFDTITAVKCKIIIDATIGAILFNLLGSDIVFAIKNGLLQEILKIDSGRKILC